MGGGRAGLAVARYLRPEEKVVPFRARPELEELLGWCGTCGHAGVRLVTGDGGAGKTRLALQLCEELAANGWQPLWVPRGSEREGVQAVRDLGQPCVLVVDYAETRRELVDLINDAAENQDGPDLRILLLARSAREWWQHLVAQAEAQAKVLLEAAGPIWLGPVPAAGGQLEVFADALTAFAHNLRVARPEATLALSDPDPVVLVVHAAALLAVIDHAAGTIPQRPAMSGAEVLEGLLGHEAGYWARAAAGRGLDLDLSVLRLAVAVGCLLGADSETAAAELLARVPDLDSGERRGQVARWLRDMYPPEEDDDVSGNEWLGRLRPDRLAEQLVVSELLRHSELVPRFFAELEESRAIQALTVLARAALTQDSAAGLLRQALASDLEHLAVPAISVTVETNPIVGDWLGQVLVAQPVSRETLIEVAHALPYPSFALAAPALVVLDRLAEGSERDSERAGWLVDLSNRLGDLGRREEALATIEQAVAIRRQLAEADPDTFLPGLAAALNNQSGRLAELGRWEEALATAGEAITLYRRLAKARPDAFLPGLAATLNNRSLQLTTLGRWEEAMATAAESVTIRRQLAEDRPGVFLPALAGSLNNQSICMGQLGRREEALAAIEEATRIYRQLAEDHPDAFVPHFTRALHNQAGRLAELGRRDEALATADQAVIFYRQLAKVRPDAFIPNLAMALDNRSKRLADLGRWEEALAPAEQAVTIYRQLAKGRPDLFLPDLAEALNNHSSQLGELMRWENALAAAEEAVAIRRQLATAHTDAALPTLASTLNNQSVVLQRLGRYDEALAAAEEAVAIRRQLATAHPDPFLPRLGAALSTQAACLGDQGRWEEALDPVDEAVTIFRKLAKTLPDVFLRDLAGSLNNQSACLAELKRWEEALASAEQAVTIYRALAEALPGVFLRDLATALWNLAGPLEALGRDPEATKAKAGAEAIYK